MSGGSMERGVALRWRQSLEAQVLRACPNCGAPACYKSHQSIRDQWPACYVEPNDPRIDQVIPGGRCLQCGALRLPREDLGEIWSNDRPRADRRP